jgi:hypothetical protein
MSIEKRGVISEEDTPHEEPAEYGEPQTKEAADALERHLVNDMVDAVAEQSKKR